MCSTVTEGTHFFLFARGVGLGLYTSSHRVSEIHLNTVEISILFVNTYGLSEFTCLRHCSRIRSLCRYPTKGVALAHCSF
jgi:hypothetical protein